MTCNIIQYSTKQYQCFYLHTVHDTAVQKPAAIKMCDSSVASLEKILRRGFNSCLKLNDLLVSPGEVEKFAETSEFFFDVL